MYTWRQHGLRHFKLSTLSVWSGFEKKNVTCLNDNSAAVCCRRSFANIHDHAVWLAVSLGASMTWPLACVAQLSKPTIDAGKQ
jgi:hypothetical protein